MIATRILSEEHRMILKVLECLEHIAAAAERDGALDEALARRALELATDFADGCHHAKEEERLFVVLEERGLPRQGGPIGVMLQEHEEGRAHVRALQEALAGAARGEAEALDTFASHASGFVALLRAHIDKEDHVLFPMAGNLLDPGSEDSLLADFRRIEAEAGGQRHARHLAATRELCAECGVEPLTDAEIPTLVEEFL